MPPLGIPLRDLFLSRIPNALTADGFDHLVRRLSLEVASLRLPVVLTLSQLGRGEFLLWAHAWDRAWAKTWARTRASSLLVGVVDIFKRLSDYRGVGGLRLEDSTFPCSVL